MSIHGSIRVAGFILIGLGSATQAIFLGLAYLRMETTVPTSDHKKVPASSCRGLGACHTEGNLPKAKEVTFPSCLGPASYKCF